MNIKSNSFFHTSIFLFIINAFTVSPAKALFMEDQIRINEIGASILPSVKTALIPGDTNYVNLFEIATCDLYEKFHFKNTNAINYSLFYLAYKGYLLMKQEGMISNPRYLTVMDFTLSANVPRMWVLDLYDNKLLYHDLVSHGKNSGTEYANSFSNKHESHKSSLGFYVTGAPYLGKNDYSLKLHGVEEGFNDNAFERGIVIHGANYVCQRFIRSNKYLGRSHGCPAVSQGLNKKLINEIQGGSCLFIYYPDKKYLKKSEIINSSDPITEIIEENKYFIN